MEIIVNTLLIAITILIVVIVEFFMYKPTTVKKIISLQEELDETASNIKKHYGLDIRYDSFSQIIKQRNQKKSFILIFSGVLLAFVLLAFIFIYETSFLTIIIIAVSSLFLIFYGLIKMAESKKIAIGLIAIIIVMVILANNLFDRLMNLSPNSYYYILVFIIVLMVSLFVFLRKRAKK